MPSLQCQTGLEVWSKEDVHDQRAPVSMGVCTLEWMEKIADKILEDAAGVRTQSANELADSARRLARPSRRRPHSCFFLGVTAREHKRCHDAL